ncbi:MAG: LytR C-terminal domain-containing protein [bacterium]|nr:LytR C-terminal domain-containing protein [bacterium]
MKQKQSALSNTRIAIFFFILLAFFVAISILFKLILVVKAGQFDDARRFNLTISNNKDSRAISLSPQTQKIAVLKLDKNIKSEKAGKFLEIPIDGYINSNILNTNQKLSSLFLQAIINYENLQTNLTIIDLLKIAFFAKTVPESSINIKTIPQSLSATDIDKIVGRLVSDELIEKDNQTIQIINATDVGGLGNRLARLITNIGGDVIIVATSDKSQKESTISYIDKKTYTVKRLNKILGYEIIQAGNSVIADVTITIGEDKANSSPF